MFSDTIWISLLSMIPHHCWTHPLVHVLNYRSIKGICRFLGKLFVLSRSCHLNLGLSKAHMLIEIRECFLKFSLQFYDRLRNFEVKVPLTLLFYIAFIEEKIPENKSNIVNFEFFRPYLLFQTIFSFDSQQFWNFKSKLPYFSYFQYLWFSI